MAYVAASTQLYIWFEEPALFFIFLVAAGLILVTGWLKHRPWLLLAGIAALAFVIAMAPLLLTVAIADGRRQIDVRVKVVDSDTRQPIPFARVEIEGGAFGAIVSSSTAKWPLSFTLAPDIIVPLERLDARTAVPP
jgi:hypothetical protein